MADTLNASIGTAPAVPRVGPTAAPPGPRRLRTELAAVWALAATTFALTLSSVPALTHDSLTYLQAIEDRGAALWHPHHLLYNAIGAGWLGLVRTFGFFADPIKIVAVLNSLLGATAVALCFLLLRRRAGLSLLLSAAGTAGAALSFGAWFYSASIEVYVLPLTFLLAAAYVLLAPTLTARHLLAVGVLHGLAMLGHQVHALFAVVIVAAVWARRDELGDALVGGLLRWAGVAAGVVVLGYGLVIALVVQPSSVDDATAWLSGYADDGSWWVVPGASTLPSAAFGAGRAIVGGHFLFRLDWVHETLAEAFPDRSLSDEAFLVRHLAPWAAVVLMVVALVGAALFVVTFVRGVRRRRLVPAPARRLVAVLAVWVATYTLFFLVWEPSNLEFWIPQVTCLWLVTAALTAPRARAADGGPATQPTTAPAAGRAGGPPGEDGHVAAAWAEAGARSDARRDRRRAGTLLAGALLIGVANLFGSILPAVDAINDVYAWRFAALGGLVGPGDAVVVDRPHLSVGYNRRHTGAAPITAVPYHTTVEASSSADADDYTAEDVVEEVQAVLDSGHHVAIDVNLIENPESREARQTRDALVEAYGDRWYEVEPVRGMPWLIVYWNPLRGDG